MSNEPRLKKARPRFVVVKSLTHVKSSLTIKLACASTRLDVLRRTPLTRPRGFACAPRARAFARPGAERHRADAGGRTATPRGRRARARAPLASPPPPPPPRRPARARCYRAFSPVAPSRLSSHQMPFGQLAFSELGSLELAVLVVAGAHVLALCVWVYLTATQKPPRVRDRVDLTKAE